jgi:dUTPase
MRLKRIGTHDLPLPKRASDGACGFWLTAAITSSIPPGQTARIPTGFAWEIDASRAAGMPEIGIPTTEFGLIRDCNGLGPFGYVVGSAVDGDDRGEVTVRVANIGDEPLHIKAGQRIGEIIIGVALIWGLEEVDEIAPTEREAA